MEKEINWEQVSEERRGKILWIPRQQIFHALIVSSQVSTQITRVALPKHYRLRDVHYEPSRNAFGFYILSPEFPENDPFQELPSFGLDEVKTVLIDLQKQ